MITSLSRPSHDYLLSLASWAAAAASPIIASDDCYWVRGAARVCRHPSSVSRCHTLITPTASPVMSRFRFSISVADFHLFTILSFESYASSHLLPLITRAREGERTSSQPSLAISSSRSALFTLSSLYFQDFTARDAMLQVQLRVSLSLTCFFLLQRVKRGSRLAFLSRPPDDSHQLFLLFHQSTRCHELSVREQTSK